MLLARTKALYTNISSPYITPKSHLYHTKKSPISHQKVTYITPKSHLFTPKLKGKYQNMTYLLVVFHAKIILLQELELKVFRVKKVLYGGILKILKTFNTKIALCFRQAQTLLNFVFTQFFGAIFSSSRCEFQKKQKQDQKQLGIRFAHQFFMLASLEREAYFFI